MTPPLRWRATAVPLLVGLALAGCDRLPGRPRLTDREERPSQVMAFDPLFARHCAGCHGADGRVGAARPLADPVYLALVPRERLRAVIADGVPGTAQPAFAASAGGPLTDAQIDALVDGMLGRWGRPEATRALALPPYAEVGGGATSDPTAVARGRGVYAAACARCHGPEGQGGPTAGPVVEPSYLALVSDQSLRTAVIAGRPDLGMPDWRGDPPERPLTPRQISDVVAWLVSQRREVPGRP